jgi:hypothetical protein
VIHVEHMISLHRNLLFVSSPLDDDAVEVSTVDSDCEKKVKLNDFPTSRNYMKKGELFIFISTLLIVSLLIKWFDEQKEID